MVSVYTRQMRRYALCLENVLLPSLELSEITGSNQCSAVLHDNPIMVCIWDKNIIINESDVTPSSPQCSLILYNLESLM